MDYSEGIIKNTEFFTTSELAEKLKMNVQVITRKVQAGEIMAYKIGKDWRIPEQSVIQWLEQHSNRNHITPKEKVIKNFVKDDHIETLPAKKNKRKYLLEYILAQFEPNRSYTEAETNNIISRYHQDFATVRREFIMENMMERSDGIYRRVPGYKFSG